MIDIELKSLPFVSLDQRQKLPKIRGIYFVSLVSRFKPIYIGKSKNIKQRLASHHKWKEFKEFKEPLRIIWLDCSYSPVLNELEKSFIKRFKPVLNESFPFIPEKNEAHSQTGRYVNKIKEKLADLGETRYKFWIKTGLGQKTAYDLVNDPEQIPGGKTMGKIYQAYQWNLDEYIVWEED